MSAPMKLRTKQVLDGDTTEFKCYRSIRGNKKVGYHDVVYVDIDENSEARGRVPKLRRRTHLRLTRRVLEDLSAYFAHLAPYGEADQVEER